MCGLEDLSEEELKKIKATFESLAAAPAASAGTSTQQLKDAADALRSAGSADLHETTEGPAPSLRGHS